MGQGEGKRGDKDSNVNCCSTLKGQVWVEPEAAGILLVRHSLLEGSL